jgi:hypothetical protein
VGTQFAQHRRNPGIVHERGPISARWISGGIAAEDQAIRNAHLKKIEKSSVRAEFNKKILSYKN